ncbi:MAG: anthranilate synthase component I family protein [Bacteroidetes bacterium]|nr:anthranilate synthase component I family protein [Bacteroidota bacterium]
MNTTYRRTVAFPIPNVPDFKARMLHWAHQFQPLLFLDSNGHPGNWDCLMGAGALQTLQCPAGLAFETLKNHQSKVGDWLFGGFSYDLKNEIEALHSAHFDGIELPDLYFFQPEMVLGIQNGQLLVSSATQEPASIFEALQQAEVPPPHSPGPGPALLPRMPQKKYLETLDRIREHIFNGDLYEINLCQEFYAENTKIDPFQVFIQLNTRTQAPFSAFFHAHEQFILCGSPERFLRKNGRMLLSQPIKGTRKRAQDAQIDAALRQDLHNSEKDRAENVMIVDLVRNDLTQFAIPGSITVPELFKVHSFKTVHQLISSVQAQLKDHAHPIDALRAAFPMGSMTGAPKVMAMELIEQYEMTRRGWYSGSLGYFDPVGDFDFNVIIRSILYNQKKQYCSVQVGGAIVYDSDPMAEFEECQTKAQAMFEALSG